MTTLGHKPAQRHFVHQLIDWERVRCRCKRYPAIGRAFPLTALKKGCESPPYYCHYMAWRLGTWHDESLFQRLEKLLRCAEALPNWENEKSLLSDTDFAAFWSLVWQLQVAEHLCKVGTCVRWSRSGPDLSVQVGSEHWFVECYTYQKSFGLLEFLNELLNNIDQEICTDYDRCLPLQLPRNTNRTGFLDRILCPFLDRTYLANAKKAAKQKYPVILYKDQDSSLYIYVEGSDVDACTPGIVPNVVGNPKPYLELALQEAVSAKQDKNALKNHRPNLLAVNFLLSADYQLAKSSQETLTLPEIEPNIDVLAVFAVGIDERLTRKKLEAVRVGKAHYVNRRNLNQIATLLGARIPGGGQ